MDTEPQGGDKAKEIHPYYQINRGRDSVAKDGSLEFVDYSPRVLPSNIPDEEIDEALSSSPKDLSAQESAESFRSTSRTTEPLRTFPGEVQTAPKSAAKGNGKSKEKTSESFTQDS